jgi:hypothetical protein
VVRDRGDRVPTPTGRHHRACGLATRLRRRDHKVCRLQKGSVTRESIRMAIGQLIDYARFVPTPRKVILLPSRPRADLEELLRSAAIDIIWATDGGFDATDIGLIQTTPIQASLPLRRPPLWRRHSLRSAMG